jgi:hypothetical protein
MSDSASPFGPVAKWGHVEFPLPEYRAPEYGRDELAALIHGETDPACHDPQPYEEDYDIADAIIADGRRKP